MRNTAETIGMSTSISELVLFYVLLSLFLPSFFFLFYLHVATHSKQGWGHLLQLHIVHLHLDIAYNDPAILIGCPNDLRYVIFEHPLELFEANENRLILLC